MKNDSKKDTPPLIDKTVLDDLQSIMEDEYTEVLQIYLEESISLMSDIHTAFDEESDNLIRAVHTLKSSSKNVGAVQLGDIAAKMEALLNDNNVVSARTYLDELQDVFTQSHALIKKYAQPEMQEAAI